MEIKSTDNDHLESVAFKTAYGKDPVWKKFRRNFKGQRPPMKTRETCIRQERITTGSPCPICRDEYLVINYRWTFVNSIWVKHNIIIVRNVELLRHFIDPYTGMILSPNKTNICQKQVYYCQWFWSCFEYFYVIAVEEVVDPYGKGSGPRLPGCGLSSSGVQLQGL